MNRSDFILYRNHPYFSKLTIFCEFNHILIHSSFLFRVGLIPCLITYSLGRVEFFLTFLCFNQKNILTWKYYIFSEICFICALDFFFFLPGGYFLFIAYMKNIRASASLLATNVKLRFFPFNTITIVKSGKIIVLQLYSYFPTKLLKSYLPSENLSNAFLKSQIN